MTHDESTLFYNLMTKMLASARMEIHDATGETVNFHIHSTMSYKGEHKPTIKITNGQYGSGELEVSGFVLSDMVAEYIRRANFATSQANLQLGPPLVDASEAPEPGFAED